MVLRYGKAYLAMEQVPARPAPRQDRDYDILEYLDLKDIDMIPTCWRPEPAFAADAWPHPSIVAAVGRGLVGRCPACGKAQLFDGVLRVAPQRRDYGAPLGLAQANDAPAYITILITGHIVAALMFMVDRMGEPRIWLMIAIFVPLTLVMALGLRPVKGGPVGLMLTLNMLKNDADLG